jgi:hypothetical protein
LTDEDIVGPAVATEEMFHSSSLGPTTAPVMRSLADLGPERLALMHGSSYSGDGGAALRDLATAYEETFLTAV